MNTFASRLKSYLIAKQTRTDGGYNNFAKAEQMEKLVQVLTAVIHDFCRGDDFWA